MAGIWKQRAGETWEDGKKLDLFWEKPSVKNTRQLSEMTAAIPIFKIVLSGIVETFCFGRMWHITLDSYSKQPSSNVISCVFLELSPSPPPPLAHLEVKEYRKCS